MIRFPMKNLPNINRLTTNLFFFVTLLIIFTACNNDDETAVGPNLNNASSQLCQNVRGAEAIYWDLSNGIPRTDLPGFVPPTVRTPGGSFLHPDFPPLSFEYPAGYSTETLRASHTAGVNLIRQDNQVVWRWLSTTTNGFPSAREIRQSEIQQMLQFLGVNANNIELLCLNEGQINPASGITTRSSTALIRSGGFTALVAAQVTALEGLPTSSVSIRMAVGPTAEFSQLVFETFLAIEWQMLYRSSGGVSLDDRDGDGTPDVQDRFPDAPTRQ